MNQFAVVQHNFLSGTALYSSLECSHAPRDQVLQ